MDGGDIRGAVHSNIRHDSAVKHVTGKAVYIDDMPVPPDSQEVALVLSPHAHARIVSIDTSAAAAAPGVSAVVSAADIPGKNDIRHAGCRDRRRYLRLGILGGKTRTH